MIESFANEPYTFKKLERLINDNFKNDEFLL